MIFGKREHRIIKKAADSVKEPAVGVSSGLKGNQTVQSLSIWMVKSGTLSQPPRLFKRFAGNAFPESLRIKRRIGDEHQTQVFLDRDNKSRHALGILENGISFFLRMLTDSMGFQKRSV